MKTNETTTRNHLRFTLVVLLAASCLTAGQVFGQVAMTKRWTFNAGSSIGTPAIGSDGTVYVPSASALYALQSTGVEMWHASYSDSSAPDLILDRQDLIFAVVSGYYGIAGYNPDGTKNLAVPHADGISWLACGTDNTAYITIYACSPSKTCWYYPGTTPAIQAISPVDVTTEWEFDVPRSTPYLYLSIGPDGTVYFATTDNRIYALDREGNKKWAFQTDTAPVTQPVVGNDGTVFVGSQDGTLYAIGPNGAKRWVFKLLDSVGAPRIGQGGVLYIVGWSNTANEHRLYAVNPDGTPKWFYEFAESSFDSLSNPAIGSDPAAPNRDGIIYVASSWGILYGISRDGTEAGDWEGRSASPPTNPIIDGQGTVYVGFGKTLYAIAGISGPPAGAWPLAGRDLRHTSAVNPFEPVPWFVEKEFGPGGFRATVLGQAGRSYSLEATTDFQTWSPITNRVNLNGVVRFIDSTAPPSKRFYRARLMP